jgi:deazaflavin-dependent oxidoreductase (nitroreductase family)
MIRWVLRILTRGHRILHQTTRGRLGRHFPGGAPVVWLSLPGRKSGIIRTTPLLGTREESGSWVVAGSGGGDSREPAWSINARAAADRGTTCDLEVSGVHCAVSVHLLSDEAERSAAYQLLIGRWRFFRSYAERAGRTIPGFRLIPLER